MHAALKRQLSNGGGSSHGGGYQTVRLAGSSPLHQAGRLPCPSGSSSGAGQLPGRAWSGDLLNPGFGKLLAVSLSSVTTPEQAGSAAKRPRHPIGHLAATAAVSASGAAGRRRLRASHCDSTRENRALTTLRCSICRWMAVQSRFGHSQLSASGALAAERRAAQDLSYGGIGLAASSSDAGFRQVGRHPPARAGAHLLPPRRGHRWSSIT